MSFWLVNLVQRNEVQKQIHGVSNGKRQVMVIGEGSGLESCDYKGLSRELFAEIKSIKLEMVILQQQVDANTRLLSSKKLKEMSSRNGCNFIDNSLTDGSCLNGSKLHLNSTGSAYFATSFIKFLRPSANKSKRPQGFHAPLRQLGELLMQLASGPIRAPVHKKARR